MTTSKSTDQDDDDVVARPFVDLLAEVKRGSLADELTTKLHELVSAVTATGKKGTLTLRLDVSMQPKTEMLVIADQVAVKVPQLERGQSLWFVDPHGNPTRRDPSQLEFEGIRVVPTTPAIGEAKNA